MLEEELANFPHLIKFFKKYGSVAEPNPKRQMLQIDKFEIFLAAQRYQLEIDLDLYKNRKFPDISHFHGKLYMILSVLINFCKEADERVAKLEKDHMHQLLSLANDVALIISNNDKLVLDVDGFANFLDITVVNEEEFQKVHKMQTSILSKINFLTEKYKAQDYSKIISSELVQANERFVKEIMYSPPSVFDTVISEYIFSSQELSDFLELCAITITNTDIEAAIYTIEHFSISVCKAIKLDEKGYSSNIIYNSAVRVLFDQAYCLGNELSRYMNQDSYFLIKCEDFGNFEIRKIQFSKKFLADHPTDINVKSLFKSKKFKSLKCMEQMTNPIDLMECVYQVVESIKKEFNKDETLTYKDIYILLLAYMTISPPVNPFSIAKFCMKWNRVQLSKELSKAKDYFIYAVEYLMTMDFDDDKK